MDQSVRGKNHHSFLLFGFMTSWNICITVRRLERFFEVESTSRMSGGLWPVDSHDPVRSPLISRGLWAHVAMSLPAPASLAAWMTSTSWCSRTWSRACWPSRTDRWRSASRSRWALGTQRPLQQHSRTWDPSQAGAPSLLTYEVSGGLIAPRGSSQIFIHLFLFVWCCHMASRI